ncbi:MAG: EamA family transporter RarD [Rhodobiaceae bacterium]|jgi:chloramphenicol-sensitive protein RarD
MLNARGLVCAVLAPLLWGFVPIYISLLGEADGLEIVVHRALWSGVILLVLVILAPSLTGGLRAVRTALSTSRLRLGFALTCGLVTFNWVIFVYAVQARLLFEAALGYFIYPLLTVMLGMLLLRERLDRWAWVAIFVVFAGVALKAANVGGLPWVALALAVSFGLYGVIRKRMGIDPLIGIFIETVMLMPLSVLYLWWQHSTGAAIFFGGGAVNVMLAIFFGVITVVPLILYHAGNRALPITVSSLLYYINPTTHMVVGLVYFRLSIPLWEWAVFGLIWSGLVVYFSTRERESKRRSPA